MRRPAIFAVLFALFTQTGALADTREIPQIVTQGFASFKALGNAAAMKIWLRGSSMEGSEEAGDELRTLANAEAVLGRFEGFEVLQLTQFGSRTFRVYVVIHYDRGPLFGSFLVYRLRNDWVIQGLRFHPAPEQILPEVLFE
jgi:hypothetical protein